MELYEQIIHHGKNLIDKYSLFPVDVSNAKMHYTEVFFIANKNVLVQIFIWKEEHSVSLFCKKNDVWKEYPVDVWLLNNDQANNFRQSYWDIPKDHLSKCERILLFIDKYYFDLLRIKGDEIFIDKSMTWMEQYPHGGSNISPTIAEQIEEMILVNNSKLCCCCACLSVVLTPQNTWSNGQTDEN